MKNFLIVIFVLGLGIFGYTQDQTQDIPANAADSGTMPITEEPETLQQHNLTCPPNSQSITFDEVRSGQYLRQEFCIDLYEYPNIPDSFPLTAITWFQAQKKCLILGKHLCSDNEWLEACQSHQHLKYPYGRTFEHEKCNIETKTPHKIGEFNNCVSYYNVYDMVGNVEEWTSGGGVGASGGDYSDGKNATCQKWKPYSRTYRNKAVGFRCCYSVKDSKREPVISPTPSPESIIDTSGTLPDTLSPVGQ